jgi:hypothetical protein
LVILLGAAATVVIFAGVQSTAWLIGPGFMALIVVIAVAPVQSWLRRHGWPGWATSLVVLVLVYGIVLGLALGTVVSIARLAAELPILAIPLTLLAKAMLVDVDPRARWADALLRASAEEPDPATPTTGSRRRNRHPRPAAEAAT